VSFTYAQPWTSTRDYVRFLIGDTVSLNANFTDEELDSLLIEWSADGRLAAAQALDALASKYARGAIRWAVPGLSVDRTKMVEALREQARSLREDARKQPFEFESVVDEYIDSAGIDWSNYITSDPEWM
jgi:hypothetical protein